MVIRSTRYLLVASLTFFLLAGRMQVSAAQLPANLLTIGQIANERDLDTIAPHNFAWSPDGRHVAYIRTAISADKRKPTPPASEIWETDTASGEERLLISAAELNTALAPEAVSSSQEDEQEGVSTQGILREFAWSPSGGALLLATAHTLEWFDLEKHVARGLVAGTAEISDPKFSPDGKLISFVREHSLHLIETIGGKSRSLSGPVTRDERAGEPDWPYENELGMHSAYWWSPNSSSVAWLATDDRKVNKYVLRKSDGSLEEQVYPAPGGEIPAVQLFVRTIAAGKQVRIDLGAGNNFYLPRVEWLPDGSHLAIERLSRSQKTLELLIADPGTGQTKSILTEQDNYWINLAGSPYFLKDSHHFLWTSERSGYRHLYLYDITGRQIVQLTQGNWAVTSLVGVDEKAAEVYFTSTQASPLERQLYRIHLDGTGLARVTKQNGTHEDIYSAAGHVFLDRWSSHSTRPREVIMRTDGTVLKELKNPSVSDGAEQLLSEEQFITLKTHMGLSLNASILKPSNFDSKKQYPVIVYVAGGPGEQAVRDAWGGDIGLWFALMAQKGYVIFAVNNRGSAGEGHYFEEPIHLRFGATEMADVRDGVLYLHTQPWVDKSHIGICGWGFGGFLALHGMLDRPQLFKAGFAGSAVTDWHLYDAVFTEKYLEDPSRNQDGWLSSTPVENAKFLSGSLLLGQATMDPAEHLENSLVLLDELLDNGKYADTLLFADRQSLFEDKSTRTVMFQKLTDFFAANL